MSFPPPSRNLSHLSESGASQCIAPTNEGQIRKKHIGSQGVPGFAALNPGDLGYGERVTA